MRRTTFAMLAVALLFGSGCGGSSPFANKPRPAIPVNLTVYINDARISVSPGSVGAGEVVFIITNQASKAVTFTVHAGGANSQSLANSGPINPQSTDQVAVDFGQPGDYTLATTSGAQTDAGLASAHQTQSALLHVGQARASASNQLLQP
jgi:hypothetical protein